MTVDDLENEIRRLKIKRERCYKGRDKMEALALTAVIQSHENALRLVNQESRFSFTGDPTKR